MYFSKTINSQIILVLEEMVGAMKSIQISLSIILGAILGPAFFFISPEWSILYGGILAGTVAYFVGELK